MKPPSPPAEGLNSSKYLSMGTASRMSDTNMPARACGGSQEAQEEEEAHHSVLQRAGEIGTCAALHLAMQSEPSV